MRDKIAVACKWPHAVTTPRPENKEIPLIPEATAVKSGVVRVMDLQKQDRPYVLLGRSRRAQAQTSSRR